MKKKILSMILTLLMVTSLVSTPAYATSEESEVSPLYIVSTQCPEEYTDYATDNILRFVSSIRDDSLGEISLGVPFSFAEADADVFYFPVMGSGEIKYLLRVYPVDGDYSAVFSPFLVDELESLAPMTSPETPMLLQMNNNAIVATIREDSYTLFEYPDYMETEPAMYSPASESFYSIVNVKDTIMNVDIRQTRDPYTLIDLDVIEHQPSGNHWCNAYCLATILRTVKPSYIPRMTARGMMTFRYTNPSSSDKLPWADVETIAGNYGCYAIAENGMISSGTLAIELNNGRPSILWLKSSAYDHAVVLRGYFIQGQTWVIWNPWYVTGNEIPVYEQYTIGGTYLPMTKSTSDWVFSEYAVAHNF